ncbi:hypothetical protein ACFFGV_08070 [Pontibacillus salicampi]|uniref:Multidrug ABC transporter ATPase n=1 Tax=Pontibacillus salicampi TaxID=1449801 RepID=A0ABV6LMB4_9BACI
MEQIEKMEAELEKYTILNPDFGMNDEGEIMHAKDQPGMAPLKQETASFS